MPAPTRAARGGASPRIVFTITALAVSHESKTMTLAYKWQRVELSDVEIMGLRVLLFEHYVMLFMKLNQQGVCELSFSKCVQLFSQ